MPRDVAQILFWIFYLVRLGNSEIGDLIMPTWDQDGTPSIWFMVALIHSKSHKTRDWNRTKSTSS